MSACLEAIGETKVNKLSIYASFLTYIKNCNMNMYQKIEDLFYQKSTDKNAFYEAINVTRVGFKHMITHETMKVETLLKISIFFNKPIEYFFYEEEEKLSKNSEFEKKYYNLLEKYNLCLEDKERLKDFRQTVSFEQQLNEPELKYKSSKKK